MMPSMYIPKLGVIEVDRLPKRIPKTVGVDGKRFNLDKELYMMKWAVNHATPMERARMMTGRLI
jgi:hypothetical protein